MTCLELIKEFEGLKLKAYKCQAGVWTVGYGSTGKDINESTEWTIEQAESRLREDVNKFKDQIDRLIKVKINENQKAALVSFAYNIGANAFKNSTLLKKLNLGDYHGASEEFLRWVKVNKEVSNGLLKRRAKEKEVFLKKE